MLGSDLSFLRVQIWIEYVPVKELRKIELEFPLPDLSIYYNSDVC